MREAGGVQVNKERGAGVRCTHRTSKILRRKIEMRAKDSEWLQENKQLCDRSRGDYSFEIVVVIDKLYEIEQEFNELQAENENNKEYIAYLQSIIDSATVMNVEMKPLPVDIAQAVNENWIDLLMTGTSEKPTDPEKGE